jgi:broad specificity phosphatase PhoE
MTIYLVRHGETAANGQSYAGRIDIALTETGQAQAQRVAATLRDVPVGAILTSPLRRARDTAAPVAAAHGLVPVIDPDLTEFDFGRYEGMPKRSAGLRLRKDHLFEPIPGGESLHDLWRRVGHVAGRLDTLKASSGVVVVVGHFWSTRLLFGHLTGLDFEVACRNRDYRPECGSIKNIQSRKEPDGPLEVAPGQ